MKQYIYSLDESWYQKVTQKGKILDLPVPEPKCIVSEKNYSIWNKPAGLLSQGTRYGDHCSLLQFVQKTIGDRSVIHLVHRLDGAAQGLVLLAHNNHAAANFSEMFRAGTIEKHYEAVVEGLKLKVYSLSFFCPFARIKINRNLNVLPELLSGSSGLPVPGNPPCCA